MSANDRHRTGTSRDLFSMEQSGQRYSDWLNRIRSSGLLTREMLLPALPAPCSRDLPELMAAGDRIAAPDSAVLKKRIQELSPWGYGIQLRRGVTTAVPLALERMVYRSHLISGTVRRLLGKDLER